MPFDQYASDLTTGSLPMYDKDKMRLQREMQHDFDHASITSTSTIHNGRGITTDNDSDISLGIRASARGYRTGGNMLPTESPVIDSKMFSNQFADFSMDAGDFDDESVEIGRGGYRTAMESTPRESIAAVNGRNARRSYPVDLFSPSPKAGRNARKENGPPPQRKPSNQTTPKKYGSARDRKTATSGNQPVSKTTETVSRSPVLPPQDDTTTGFFSTDEKHKNQPRSSRRQLFQNIQQSPRQKHNDLAVPTSFKSTKDFIRELGLNGDTATVNLDKKNQQPEQQPTATLDMTTQSFLFPEIPDMSEILGDVTRPHNRKRRSNAPGNNSTYMPSPFHRPIESIPVPQDERATLMAMRELHEKMESLEMDNENLNRQSVDLERQYLLMKDKYQVEHKRVEMLQRELENVRTGKGPNESDPREIEKLNGLFSSERMRLETTISNLRTRVDELTHQIELSRIALKNAQSERNVAVSQAAELLADRDEQASQNVALKKEMERLRTDRFEAEKRFERQKSELVAREERWKREAKKDTSPQNFEARRVPHAEREDRDFEKEVREMVWREVRRIRPELLPNTVPAETTRAPVYETRLPEQRQPPAPTPAPARLPTPSPRTQVSEPSDLTLDANEFAKVFKEALRIRDHKAALRERSRIEGEAQAAQERARRAQEEADRLRREAEDRARADAERARLQKEAEEREKEAVEARIAYERHAAAAQEARDAAARLLGQPVTTVRTVRVEQPVVNPGVQQPQHLQQRGHTQQVAAPQNGDGTRKKRRVKKVVYYTEGDTSEIIPSDVERENVRIRRSNSQSSAHSGTTLNADASTEAARQHENGATVPVPSTPRPGNQAVGPEAEKANVLSNAAHALCGHDMLNCTFCQRHSSSQSPTIPPLIQDILIRLFSTQALKSNPSTPVPAHRANIQTDKPSNNPQVDLKLITKQLTDEFEHLKMKLDLARREFIQNLVSKKGDAFNVVEGATQLPNKNELNMIVKELEWRANVIYGLSVLAGEQKGGAVKA